jgi:hypothetical protein
MAYFYPNEQLNLKNEHAMPNRIMIKVIYVQKYMHSVRKIFPVRLMFIHFQTGNGAASTGSRKMANTWS